MVSKPAFLKTFTNEMSENLDSRQWTLCRLIVLAAVCTPLSIALAQVFLTGASLFWLWHVIVDRRWRPGTMRFFWPLVACFVTTLLAVVASDDVLNSATALKKFYLF